MAPKKGKAKAAQPHLGSEPLDSDYSGDDVVEKPRRAAAYNLLQVDDGDDTASSNESGDGDRLSRGAVQAKKVDKKPAKAGKKEKARRVNGTAKQEDIDTLVAMIEERSDQPAQRDEAAAEKRRAKRERQKAAAKKKADETVKDDTVVANEGKQVDDRAATDAAVKAPTALIKKPAAKDKHPEEGAKVEDVKAKVVDAEAAPKEGAIAAGTQEDKKKKKKGKTDKVDDVKEKKKKTPADIIRQALKKRQEEEERLRQLQLEEERRLEELERQRLEKERIEREKKELKKQREKERIEKLKKEGKYMTAEQKQKLQRQRALVEALKQQGFSVPDIKQDGGDVAVQKSRPVYTNRKRQKKEVKPKESEAPVVVAEGLSEEKPSSKEASSGEDIVDSWDQIEVSRRPMNKDEKNQVDNGRAITKSQSRESESPPKTIDESRPEPTPQVQSQRPPSPDNGEEYAEEKPIGRSSQRHDSLSVDTSYEEGSLRSPVICVLGHVDTGKTKILDKIRRTNVQDSEAGGITQQIGATFVPQETLRVQAGMVPEFAAMSLRLPGLLIIDTPGHESFSNLRSRGSSLCDIAVLVVDIMHGLEPQTIESINLLKQRKTPCVVALNKVDRLYDWKGNPNRDIRQTLKSQQSNATIEFRERVKEVIGQFAEQGLNATLFWENKDLDDYISLVPTSAHTGDGMGNLMAAVVHFCQTKLSRRLEFKPALQCTVLEVKQISGLGTTIDVILVNGFLRVGDTVVVAGSEGPIVSQIRELLMPHPLRELRVKNPYLHNKVVRGAQGVKVVAKDFEKALAGLPLLVAKSDDEIERLKEEISCALKHVLQSIKLSERGVYVQASTLGSLEALLEFLRTQKIPYFGINVGPVHKRDVMKASAMLERDSHLAVILAFDVKIERDAQLLADELGVRIFQADIIYHLEDAFLKYREELRLKKRQEFAHLAIFPCKLRVLPQHVYKSRDPIIVGVSVDDGILKVGVPLCVPSKENLFIGTVASIEQNHKELQSVRKGTEVCIKIENTTGEAPKMYGRHFDYQDFLVSRISRETIDVCKEYFREDLQKSDWQLVVELKKVFEIV
uniref:Eukaryotic translation initiation factor 5B n=1 Tax=Trichuris muris TaxID=70415 RepID=A0A5S6QLD4_TRIMR